jgi:hypothetical protein
MRQLSLDRYVIDTLMPDLVGHDRRPSSFLVYLFLWASADGSRTRTASASQRAIAEGTGLSKRAVQDALAQLERRHLVAVDRAHPTAVPRYVVQRPWTRRSA